MKKSIKQKRKEKAIRQKRKEKLIGSSLYASDDFEKVADTAYKTYSKNYDIDTKKGIAQKKTAGGKLAKFSKTEFYSVFASYLDDDKTRNNTQFIKNPGKFIANKARKQTNAQRENVINNLYKKFEKNPELTRRIIERDPKIANALNISRNQLRDKINYDDAFAGALYTALQSDEFVETVYNEETGEYEEIEGFHAYADDGSPI